MSDLTKILRPFLVLMNIGTGFMYMHLMGRRVSARNFCICPMFVSM